MLSETGLHKAHIGRTRAECRTQSSRASLARPRRASASHFRAPDTPSTGVDDSAPLTRTAHRKACADAVSRHRAGWLGGSRQADPSSNKGLLHCVHAFVLSKEVHHLPPPRHREQRQVANLPTVCMQREPIEERASRLYVSPSCGVPRDDASGHALVRGHQEGEDGENNRTPSRIELARPFQFANRNRQ